MLNARRLLARLDLQNRFVRGVIALASVSLLLFGLWQAGVFLGDPNEAVEIKDASGQAALISIRTADVSIETPDGSGRDVAVQEGRLAPNFEVSTLTGDRVRLADFRGKAVYLNFWATWCGPCRAEMPDIEAVLRVYEADGLVVLAVNNGESFRPANAFIDELALDLTVVGLDPNQQVVGLYRVRAMPTSIFIDRDGVITKIHAGFATAKQMDQFVSEALGISSSGR